MAAFRLQQKHLESCILELCTFQSYGDFSLKRQLFSHVKRLAWPAHHIHTALAYSFSVNNLDVGTFPKEHARTVIETHFFQLLLGH